MHSIGPGIYRSGDLEIDSSQRLIRVGGETLTARARTFDLLLYLIQHRDRVVSREELLSKLWQDAHVTSNSLSQCVNEARKVLGDDPRQSRFIRTVAKSGYQFIGPVDEGGDYLEEITSVEVEYEESGVPRQSNWLRWALAAALLTSTIGGLAYWRAGANPLQAGAVIVLPFENSTAAGDLEWLRQGLPDMLITNLSLSPGLNVLGREQVRAILAGNQQTPAFDRAVSWGRQHKADIVITGSFARLGDRIRVAAQIYRTADGGLRSSAVFLADRPEQILTHMDLASLKLASALGRPVPREDRLGGLSSLMTANLEAYRFYAMGLEKADALRPAEAIDLFTKATLLDPNFAMAHARIGYSYSSIWGRPDEAKPSLETAFRLSDRLTPPDRLHIAAWYAIANRDYLAAIRSYQSLIANNPRDVEAYTRLGSLLSGERRTDEAISVLEQALVLDPNSATTWNVLSGAQTRAGKAEASINSAQRYIALAPAEPNAWDTLGMALHVAGKIAESEKAYLHALSLKPDFAIAMIHLANLAYQGGRYQEAIRRCEQFVAAVPSPAEKGRGHGCLAMIYSRLRMPDKAMAEAEASHRDNPADTFSLAMAVLERGDRQRAKALSQVDPGSSDRGRRAQGRNRIVLAGRIAMAEGRSNDSLDLFRKALEQNAPLYGLDWYEDCLADAYFELERYAEAATEYRRVVAKYPSMSLARYGLAKACEKLGKSALAREEYRRFLADWQHADRNLPEVLAAGRKS